VQEIMSHRILLGAAQLALGTVLVLCLYVYSATASISDEYSPGISAFRFRLHPLLLIGCFVVAPMVVGLLGPTAWRSASQLADRLALTAFIVSTVFLIGLVVADVAGVRCRAAPPAPPRELVTMLRHSLRCPEFSNHSYSAPFWTAGISLAMVFVSRRTQNRGTTGDDPRGR
jgi:hypothetical protein